MRKSVERTNSSSSFSASSSPEGTTAMSDNVIDFPERREVIPVNAPDIPNLEGVCRCPSCGGKPHTLLATKEMGLTGVICDQCGYRAKLTMPSFFEPVLDPEAV